jgi:hypothetical protein
MSDTDLKYITFKRDDFLEWLAELTTLDLSRVESPMIVADALELSIADAVVIRRQDTFASPALLTYAAMIGMVARNHPTPPVAQELLQIADYFQRMGEQAGDEAYKLPTL